MTTSFPTTIDDFTNPTPSPGQIVWQDGTIRDESGSIVSGPHANLLHATQHANVNDAIEALEAKVGENSSAVTSSHDYKIAQLEISKQDVLTFPLSAALGGTGIANGAGSSLTLPNLAITLGGGGAAQTYTLPAAGGTFALLNAANVFTQTNTFDSIQLSLTPTYNTPGEGKMYWNVDEGTYNIGMPGGDVNLQVGQEILRRVKNDEGSDLPNGTVVYISGSDGANLLIKKAKADAKTTSTPRTLYMTTEEILTGQHGYVAWWGDVHDTNANGYAAGTVLWLSSATAGQFTDTRPSAPNYKVKIGGVLKSGVANGIITMSQYSGGELNDIADVQVTDPMVTDGALMTYYLAGKYWRDYGAFTGGGTFASGGFTGTLPETMTLAGRNVANTFTADQIIAANYTLWVGGQADTVPSTALDWTFSVSGDLGGMFLKCTSTSEPFVLLQTTGSASGFQMRGMNSGGVRFTNWNGTTELFRADTANGNFGIGVVAAPSARLHTVISGTSTTGISEVARFEARISTAATGAAATFGPYISLAAETATADTYQIQGTVSGRWTDPTNATRNSRLQLDTYPAGSAVGHCAMWSQTGITDTAQTIIVNGAGDVTEAITVLYSAAEVTGTDTGGGTVTLEPNNTFDLCSDGTNTLTLTCASDGSVTIARSAGTDTYKVSLWMVWL